jgi:hypothetical protein
MYDHERDWTIERFLKGIAPRTLPLIAALGVAAPACSNGDADDTASDASTGAETGGTSGDGDGDGDGDAQARPSPSVRMMRLTHQEWGNTIQDLLGIQDVAPLLAVLRADPNQSGFVFDNNYESLSVDEALWNGYRIAAAAAAAAVLEDGTLKDSLFPPSADPLETRIAAFVDAFGTSAFRRPLSETERAAYITRFSEASAYYPDTDPTDAGIAFTIDSMLQSPFFVYRIEQSEQVVDDSIPLDDYEIASRMSYFLLDSMPDPALFARAEAGELSDPAVRRQETQRLLATTRGADTMLSFHDLLLKFESFEAVNPSPAFFPDVSPSLGVDARTEAELFIRELIHADKGSLKDLLTSTESYVNAGLAEIYGLAGTFSETEFERVQLDPERRLGLFTRTGYLAHNASSVNPDPIHRGVFLATKMSCLGISAPPDDITPVPPQADDKTNREMVESHTEDPETVCVQCHKPLINPYGFPFENYDAIGAWRDTDNGKPVDAATEPFIGGEKVPVANANELMATMAEASDVHRCYVKHWIEYAYGRNATEYDTPTYDMLGDASRSDDLAVETVLVELVASPIFVSRAAEELQ